MGDSKVCLMYCIVLHCMGEKYMFANCGLRKIYNKLLLGVRFCKDDKKRHIRVYCHHLGKRYDKNRNDGTDND